MYTTENARLEVAQKDVPTHLHEQVKKLLFKTI